MVIALYILLVLYKSGKKKYDFKYKTDRYLS